MMSDKKDTDALFHRVWKRVSSGYPSSSLIPEPMEDRQSLLEEETRRFQEGKQRWIDSFEKCIPEPKEETESSEDMLQSYEPAKQAEDMPNRMQYFDDCPKYYEDMKATMPYLNEPAKDNEAMPTTVPYLNENAMKPEEMPNWVPYLEPQAMYSKDMETTMPSSKEQKVNIIPMLQDMVLHILERRAYHRALAMRTNGTMSRSFSQMSKDDLKYAKRLSTSCFLICGVKYWPNHQQTVSIPSLLSAMRDRFMDAQSNASEYLNASTEMSDPYLSALLAELADNSVWQAEQIRTMLEQM